MKNIKRITSVILVISLFITAVISGASLVSAYDFIPASLTYNTTGGTLFGFENPICDFSFSLDSVASLKFDELVPQKDDFVFDGWYSDESFTKRVSSYVDIDWVGGNYNCTVYAKWLKDIDSALARGIVDKDYSGKGRIQQGLTLTYDNVTLVKDEDYEVSYKDNKNAGVATIIIKGIGDFGGVKYESFNVTPRKIIPTVTLSNTKYVYNGEVKKPAVTVTYKGNKFATSHYKVTYASGRKNVGKYSVKVTLTGNYNGTNTKYFKISPRSTELTKLVSKDKGFTATWKKRTLQSSGYQIEYSTSSDFEGSKKVTISDNTKTSKKISNLKDKKKYYVRIRAYKLVKDVKYYSKWSDKKSVTTSVYDDGISVKFNKDETKKWYLKLIGPYSKPLAKDYKPSLSTVDGYPIHSKIAESYKAMKSAAAKDGVNLYIISGYRSYQRQENNFNNRYNLYLRQGYSKSAAYKKTASIIAVPGTSEHHLGLAMDLNSLDQSFGNTKAGKWLAKNSYKYGFILRYKATTTNITGIVYEPWHFRYVSVRHAKKIKEMDVTLEEYIKWLKTKD
jgi:uncharacterized repeat protein (TIGR02543 family)